MFQCRGCQKQHETNEARVSCERTCVYSCETCDAGPGERHRATTERPDMETLEAWVCDSVVEATDGCSVEPDGRCEHGHRSWLLVLGVI